MLGGILTLASLDDITHLVINRQVSFIEAEKTVLGIDHAEIGGLIAENWQFPEKMVYIIRHHHLLKSSARQDLETAMVYLAGAICMKTGACAASAGTTYGYYDDIVRLLKLKAQDVVAIVRAFDDDKHKINALIHMA